VIKVSNVIPEAYISIEALMPNFYGQRKLGKKIEKKGSQVQDLELISCLLMCFEYFFCLLFEKNILQCNIKVKTGFMFFILDRLLMSLT
jgi:hypothetical protein